MQSSALSGPLTYPPTPSLLSEAEAITEDAPTLGICWPEKPGVSPCHLEVSITGRPPSASPGRHQPVFLWLLVGVGTTVALHLAMGPLAPRPPSPHQGIRVIGPPSPPEVAVLSLEVTARLQGLPACSALGVVSPRLQMRRQAQRGESLYR